MPAGGAIKRSKHAIGAPEGGLDTRSSSERKPVEKKSSGRAKFQELILYIARKSACDPNFGATKLNKILFYADFLAYRQHGTSITGQPYFKLPNGPAPRTLKPMIQQMESSGVCTELEVNYFGRTQRRIVARREPDFALFSPAEIALVDEVIQLLWDNNAREVSELSHRFIGWQAAKVREDIPFETVFVGDPAAYPLTEEEVVYGQRLAGELSD